MRDEELNGDHVRTLEDPWMDRIMVHHLEPGIFISRNLLHSSKQLIIMSFLIRRKSGGVVIAVVGVVITVTIVMDLAESVEEIQKVAMNQKLVTSVAEMAIEDVMFVMAQEKILYTKVSSI